MCNLNIFMLVVLCSISFKAFSNDCLAPVEFAKSFYKTENAFYADDPKKVENLVTPEFFTALNLNWACAVKNSGLCVDYSPWSNSNSIELGEPISAISEVMGKNEVRVKFTFEYKWSEKSKPDLITDFLLLKKYEGSCWKVNDLILTSGESLSKIFSQ